MQKSATAPIWRNADSHSNTKTGWRTVNHSRKHIHACARTWHTTTTTITTILMQITCLCRADRIDPVPLQPQDSRRLAATDWLMDFVTWMSPLPFQPLSTVPWLLKQTLRPSACCHWTYYHLPHWNKHPLHACASVHCAAASQIKTTVHLLLLPPQMCVISNSLTTWKETDLTEKCILSGCTLEVSSFHIAPAHTSSCKVKFKHSPVGKKKRKYSFECRGILRCCVFFFH